MSQDWFELGRALAPIVGILLALLIIAPPDFRSREERRRSRERRRDAAKDAADADHWTCGRLRK